MFVHIALIWLMWGPVFVIRSDDNSESVSILVMQLSSSSFQLRDRASERLSKLKTIPVELIAACSSTDAEVRERALRCVASIKKHSDKRLEESLVALWRDKDASRMIDVAAVLGGDGTELTIWTPFFDLAESLATSNSFGAIRPPVPQRRTFEDSFKGPRRLAIASPERHIRLADSRSDVCFIRGRSVDGAILNHSAIVVSNGIVAESLRNCYVLSGTDVFSSGKVHKSIVVAGGSVALAIVEDSMVICNGTVTLRPDGLALGSVIIARKFEGFGKRQQANSTLLSIESLQRPPITFFDTGVIGVRFWPTLPFLLAAHVIPETPAYDVGLRTNDMVFSIDSQPVPDIRCLEHRLRIASVDKDYRVRIEVLRRGERVTLSGSLYVGARASGR